MKPKTIQIDSRDQLLNTLAEAAELEHSLMCVYLYAAFSLKTSLADGLNDQQLTAVKQWHKAIVEVAVQEMGHLALVANITSSIGGKAHFSRPDFPVRPGYFPEDFVLNLGPFDAAMLDHFIFLERPEEEHSVSDDGSSADGPSYKRETRRHMLMSQVGDYETVGQLYRAIEQGIERLTETIGEKALFCGAEELQLDDKDVKLKGFHRVVNLATCKQALSTIVEQGEGARVREGSHFATFSAVKESLSALRQDCPDFSPALPVVRNPSSLKPVSAASRVWVENALTSRYLDVANAIYTLMLRCLGQLYTGRSRTKAARHHLLDLAFKLMHQLARVGGCLVHMPVSVDDSPERAGLTFTSERCTETYELEHERQLIGERLRQIIDACLTIAAEDENQDRRSKLQNVAERLSDNQF